MTDLRTAAQQALEALQNCANGEDDVLLTRDALAALRAALVEDAMQKFTDVSQEIEAALAEPRPIHECYGDCPTNPQTCPNPCNFEGRPKPVQEPVAWRTFDGEGGYDYRTYEDNESYAAEWEKRNPRHVGWVEPLYTAPRPAEPVQEPVACSNTFACRCPKHYTAEPVQEPQRKPLTVEEIADAAKSVPAAVYELMHGHEISVGKFRAALAEFARAIERAHNIKE